ncbi:MAG: AAA family ATPase, partial [Armatimonadota bacterium]|nr:AAA family ATPase [Armatimonadota bacterium]
IRFPEKVPIILVGENNAGKSNIVRALEIILGETWPGSKEPEDHDFWNRNPDNVPIEITCEFEGFLVSGKQVEKLLWTYNSSEKDEKCKFRAIIGGKEQYVSNEMRDQCICIVVGADRRLSYHLSYTSKYTLLSKLMRKFHSHLIKDRNKVDQLKQKFDEVKSIFEQVKEFSDFQSELSRQFEEVFAGMTYGLQVDFSAYDPTRYFHSLRLLPEENGMVRTFEELGSGQEQLLALTFAYAYAKAFFGGIILVIEEPEAHLHPLAQQWLARRIRKMAEDGLQIVITTHSPTFVDILGLEGLVLVFKVDNITKVKQLTAEDLARYCCEHEAHPQRTQANTVLSFYAAHATQEILSGFFARKIILVEGQTEAFALPIYLNKVGLDVTKEGIAVIPVMGKGNLAKWWRLFTAYGIPVFLMFDNDSSDDYDGNKRRDALRTIGIKDDKNLTQILSIEDWQIEEHYCIFGKDFERTMRKYFSDYSNLEEQAKNEVGESKPLVARYVAEHLMFDSKDKGWKKWKELADKIRRLKLNRSLHPKCIATT